MAVRQVKLELIRMDGGTQIRDHVSDDVVEDYSEKVLAGDDFPAVVVFDDGAEFWLGDGFHRTLAHKKAGKSMVLADVREGSKRDAILHALGANSNHGLRRNNADKRRAVMVMLEDSEWRTWTDRRIADACGVSHTFVSGLRPTGNGCQQERVGYGGKKHKYKPKQGDSQPPQTEALDASDDDNWDESPQEPAPDNTKNDPNRPEWADFNAQVMAQAARVREENRKLSRMLDAVKAGNLCRARFAHFLKYQTTVGAIELAIENVENGIPGRADPKPPGFITIGIAKDRENFERAKRERAR